MTLSEYQKKSQKTDIRDKNIKMICNGFGLIGELDELEEIQNYSDSYHHGYTEDSSIVKEVGDCLWYISSICTELNISMQEVVHIFDASDTYNHNQNMAEVFKKTYRDNNGEFTGKYYDDIIYYIGYLLVLYLPQFCILEEAMDKNVKKLQSRLKRNKIQGDGNTR